MSEVIGLLEFGAGAADHQRRIHRGGNRLELGAGFKTDEHDAVAPGIEILQPLPGEKLSYSEGGGQVTFEWRGEGETFWIEYLLGTPPLQISGSFQVAQKRVVFGPVPEGFWNDVAMYSPSRIRIADAENRERSSWVEFEVLPVQ